MKKFKKLIPALCMLLISAVLMGTSTYAWFSMNMSVTATGMTVTAKSNSTYLLIDTVDNAATKTASAVTKIATNHSATIYPVAFNDTADEKTVNGVNVPVNGWYTANSKSPSDNGLGTNEGEGILNAKIIAEADLNKSGENQYALVNTFWLSLSSDSEDFTGKLNVTLTKTSAHESVSVVIKVENNGGTATYYKLGNTQEITNFTLSKSTSC